MHACPRASPSSQVKDLKEHQAQRVAQYIQQHYTVGDELKRSIRDNVLALIRMQSYRGQRWGAHTLGPWTGC